MAGNEHEHNLEPIGTRPFPWARVGLALGTGFAALFAVLAGDDAQQSPPAVTAEPIVVEATPPTLALERQGTQAKSFAPIDPVPWPPGRRHSTGTSRGGGRFVEDGDSALTVQQAESFYEKAFASCAPTRFALGKSVTLFCEDAREESRVVIVPRDADSNHRGDTGGTWLRTSRRTFALPGRPDVRSVRPAAAAADDDDERPSCGWTMRFVALPDGASVNSSGGGDDSGHCTFEVNGNPASTWSTMLGNIFRPGTTVYKRQLDDGVLSRWTAEGWDGGWWRVDVVFLSTDDDAEARVQRSRVELSRWSPGEKPWQPPFSFEDKVEALTSCWEPCALALRDTVPNVAREDVRAEHNAEEVMDRCLYECRGTEQAPAVLEPAARAFAPVR